MPYNTSMVRDKFFTNGTSNFPADGSFLERLDPLEYLSSDGSTLPSTPPTPLTQRAHQDITSYMPQQQYSKTRTEGETLVRMQALAQQLQFIDRRQELEGVDRGLSTMSQQPRVQPPQEPSDGCGFEVKKKGASKSLGKRRGIGQVPKGKKQTAQQKEVPSAALAFPLPPGPVVGGEQWSRGSKNHYLGQCRPCKAFNAPHGCEEGAACNFCHCKHDQQKHAESDVYSAKACQRRCMVQVEPDSEKNCACNRQAHAKTVESRVFDEPWYAPVPSSLMMTYPPGLDFNITLSL